MQTDLFVSPAWVSDQSLAKDCLLFEVGDHQQQEYTDGHLPGAVYFDTNIFEHSPEWNILAPGELGPALQALGISSDRTVVLYGGNRWAVARAAFVLAYAGAEKIHWMVGGKEAWQAGGYPLETGQTLPAPVSTFGEKLPLHPEYLVSREQVQSMLTNSAAIVADTRTWDEHTGRVSGYSYIEAKGRIPGSIWIGETPDWTPPAGSTDMGQDALQAGRAVVSRWIEKGISPNKHIAFYCGTGWRASEAFWIARCVGWRHVSVYDGGWLEWGVKV